jgi:hypothetical protein
MRNPSVAWISPEIDAYAMISHAHCSVPVKRVVKMAYCLCNPH